MEIYIKNAKLLVAASRFVNGEEHRGGVFFIFLERAANGVLITATNGHGLFHAHDEYGVMSQDSALVRFRKVPSAGWWSAPDILIKDDIAYAGDRALPVDYGECVYPDYRAVCPSSCSGKPAIFHPKYLAEFDEVGARLAGSSLKSIEQNTRVEMNGEHGAARILFEAGVPAFGVLMPMRKSERSFPVPVLPSAVKGNS